LDPLSKQFKKNLHNHHLQYANKTGQDPRTCGFAHSGCPIIGGSTQNKDVKSMNYFIIIPAAVIAFAVWNLVIAILGLFPQCRTTAVGTLTKTKTKRNYRTNRGHFIPISTKYIYTYTVNGKEYRYTGDGRHSDRRLLPKAPMVYIKGFPRHAYPHKFTGVNEWGIGITMLMLGIVCLRAFLGVG
jgi:hypothetical protein